MQLLIVGTLKGQLTTATKIAMDRGAAVTHAESIDQALAVLRSGKGADLVMVDVIYDGFLKRVSEGRRIPVDQVDRVAQGRVWLGEQAIDVKLVDALGGLDQAIELLRKKANLSAGEAIRLIPYPGRRSLLDQMFRQRRESDLSSDARALLSRIRASGVTPWLEGGMLRVMPYRLEIR